jgi:hypothetical protein
MAQPPPPPPGLALMQPPDGTMGPVLIYSRKDITNQEEQLVVWFPDRTTVNVVVYAHSSEWLKELLF